MLNADTSADDISKRESSRDGGMNARINFAAHTNESN